VPKKRLSKSSLLWFIRSRSYATIPDIRRRFHLDGGEEVNLIVSQHGRIYVGLPADATRALGDLVREGRVGLELQPSLHARAAIGAYVIPQPRLAPGHERAAPEEEEPPDEDDEGSAVAS
jgi:hypothetical protein